MAVLGVVTMQGREQLFRSGGPISPGGGNCREIQVLYLGQKFPEVGGAQVQSKAHAWNPKVIGVQRMAKGSKEDADEAKQIFNHPSCRPSFFPLAMGPGDNSPSLDALETLRWPRSLGMWFSCQLCAQERSALELGIGRVEGGQLRLKGSAAMATE